MTTLGPTHHFLDLAKARTFYKNLHFATNSQDNLMSNNNFKYW